MAATTAQTEVQDLLRFMTKRAGLILSEAMSKIQPLMKMSLTTPEAIAKARHADLKIIFTDEKVLKQVVSAAKRVSNPNKKTPASKTPRGSRHVVGSDANNETDLMLPTTDKFEEELYDTQIETNRAPLFLAFALVVLSFTHPDQPLSSRLSLAQAVVSAGAQSKAKYIGLSTAPTAEEDGWAMGQPKIRIMGRDVAVMRRHIPAAASASISQDTIKTESQDVSHEAYWGLDLEALRKSNGPLVTSSKDEKTRNGPPVHMPHSARQYLLRSMMVVHPNEDPTESKGVKVKKATAAEMLAKKEEAAASVLKAIEMVCISWKDTLTTEELDRRAQTWYTAVRPDVAQGPCGWGQRGVLRLSDILKLKRTT